MVLSVDRAIDLEFAEGRERQLAGALRFEQGRIARRGSGFQKAVGCQPDEQLPLLGGCQLRRRSIGPDVPGLVAIDLGVLLLATGRWGCAKFISSRAERCS